MVRIFSYMVAPAGGSTPPTITSPISPAAWHPTTEMTRLNPMLPSHRTLKNLIMARPQPDPYSLEPLTPERPATRVASYSTVRKRDGHNARDLRRGRDGDDAYPVGALPGVVLGCPVRRTHGADAVRSR